ncbi:hypothetical protein [Ekhidna sp.]|uniref:hypothetical protein n=1 Tax=Ekhidna sp. TaxID=2608089 RepID=UPI0035195545
MNKALFLILVVLVSACAVNKGTKTIHPYNGGSVGCGNFIVYKLTDDNTEYVSVVLDASSIELEQTQAYAIGIADVVKVTRKKYAGSIASSLCNDVMADKPEELLEEIASEGIVEVRVSEVEIKKAEKKEAYKATIILKNVVFDGVVIDYLRLEDVTVGWLPG